MFTIRLELRKSTKNKVVYDNPDFGSLYVPNDLVQELGAPNAIEITIAAAPVELREAA